MDLTDLVRSKTLPQPESHQKGTFLLVARNFSVGKLLG